MWTGDGKVFFYNPSTKTSLWERPSDLKGRPDVDECVKKCPVSLSDENESSTSSTQNSEQKAKRSSNIDDPITVHSESEDGEESDDADNEGENNVQNESTKRKNEEDDSKMVKRPKQYRQEPEITDPEVLAEMEAAKKREMMPIEERMEAFRQMLVEKEVSFDQSVNSIEVIF